MDFYNYAANDEQLNEPLEFLHSTCFYCNGYYGPCFGEPVCPTCHDFLYCDDFEAFQNARSHHSFFAEKDDGDSGNDEPSEEAGPSSRPLANVDQAPARLPLSPAEEEPAEVDVEPPPVEDLAIPDDPAAEDVPENSFPSRWPLSPSERISNRLTQLTTPRSAHEIPVSKEDMSLSIPPEIWTGIFKKLDDISLLMVSKVNRKWKAIVLDQYPNEVWEHFVKMRLPLFHPVYAVADWYSVYCDFIDSVPCKLCFMNLLVDLPVENHHHARSLRAVRLHKELKWLKKDHPEGIEAVPLDALNYSWLARINGPPQSPYQGGVFYLNLKIPHDYPLQPPIVRFLTKILHPNVSRHGDIGIDCIQHNWTLALTIPQILLSVQSLLTDPYLETCMEPDLASIYQNDRESFDKMARVWTWKFAMHDVLVH